MMIDTSAYQFPSPWAAILPQLAQQSPFAQGYPGAHGIWPGQAIGNPGIPVGAIPPQIALQSLCHQLGALAQVPAPSGYPVPPYGQLPLFGGNFPGVGAPFGGGFGSFPQQHGFGGSPQQQLSWAFPGLAQQLAGGFPGLTSQFGGGYPSLTSQFGGGYPSLMSQFGSAFPGVASQLGGGLTSQFAGGFPGLTQQIGGPFSGLPPQFAGALSGVPPQLALAGLIGPSQAAAFGRWPLSALGSSYAPASQQMAYTG